MRHVGWFSGAALAAALVFPALSYGGNVVQLEFQKTVSTSPTGCAAANKISVEPGTTVYYCYKVTNVSVLTFTMHSLEDSVLGPITLPSGGVFDLAPGEVITATANAVIQVTTRNVATYTASVTDTDGMTDETVAAQQVVATVQSDALVTIDPAAAPALSDAALAFVGAALLAFGAFRLSRKLRDQA